MVMPATGNGLASTFEALLCTWHIHKYRVDLRVDGIHWHTVDES